MQRENPILIEKEKTSYRMLVGIAMILTASVFWGLSGTCGQYLFQVAGITPLWLTAMRMLISGIVLSLILLVKKDWKSFGIWTNRTDIVQLIIFSLFGLMFCQYSYLAAISYTNAGTATVMQYLGPVLVLIFVCFRKKRLPDCYEIIAICLAVFGTFMLATHGRIDTLVISPKGLLWGLISAVGLMCYTLLPEQIIARWGSLCVTAFGMLMGGSVLSIYARVWEINITWSAIVLGALFGVIILGTAVSFFLYLYSVQLIGPIKASMIATVEPIAAVLFTVILMHTRFTAGDIVGLLAITATILLLTKSKN